MRSLSLLKGYGVTLLATAVATLLSWLFQAYLADTPFMLFGAAVAVSAWYGGIGPGLAAVVLACIVVEYLFFPFLTFIPIFGIPLPVVPVGSFVVVGSLIAALLALLRAAQRKAETAVRRRDESLALLDTLLAAAPVGLGFLDRDFRFVRLNDTLAHMIGMVPEGILSQTVQEIIPRLWPTLGPLLHAVIETGESVSNVEVSGETPAAPGTRRSWLVSYYPVRVRQDDILGIGVVVVEITDRKRAEEQRERMVEDLAAERSWLRTVIERSPVGIILVQQANGPRVVTNSRMDELFGRPITPSGGIAQYVEQVRRADGTPMPYADMPVARALRGEPIRSEEHSVRRPDGRDVPVLVSAAPIRNVDGRILGAVVVFEDVTPLKELERLRDEWTSVIAHDLRQPVTIIVGYTGVLQRLIERQAPAAAEMKPLEHIRVAADNLNRMIADLLDVSRIEARRLVLERHAVELTSLISFVIERVATIMMDHPICLEVKGAIPQVDVDPSRIEQILGNIFSNAAKYGYPGTEIRVEVERRDGEIDLSVTNYGPGIPAEDLPRLFDRFYRTREARAERKPGVGLGLYITKGLVEAHGGRIWAESVPGQTTTFHVTLPISRVDQRSDEPRTSDH